MRRLAVLAAVVLDILSRLLHRRFLLGPHCKSQIAFFFVKLSISYGDNCRAHLLYRAAELLSFGIGHAVDAQHPVDFVVGKDRAVIAHRRLLQHDAVGRLARPGRGILRRYPLLHAFGGIAHLEQAPILRVRVLVGVDFGGSAGCGGKKSADIFKLVNHKANHGFFIKGSFFAPAPRKSHQIERVKKLCRNWSLCIPEN